MFVRLFKEWFGDFTTQELKKFALLGLTFGVVIGIYWTLRVAKDSIFMSIVGRYDLGWAKIVSLIFLLPIVVVYSKMIDRFPRHRILYVLSCFYALCIIVFGILFLHPVIGLGNTDISRYRFIGWAWYVFVESYGSLMAAAFWAFATDTTDSNGARKGFPFVALVAQTVSILGPLFLAPLARPERLGSTAYVVIICGILIFMILFLIALFMRIIPAQEMVGYVQDGQSDEKESTPGFLEGLKLLVSQPYLLGIFSIIAIYEAIITIVDFNFKNMAAQTMITEATLTGYLGEYALWVNFVSALCLWLGVGSIQRRLGLRVSLMVMPCIIGIAIWMFYAYQVVHVLFWIMVAAKALNYAINSPSLKQLYVPTSKNAKYKSQAWIETFGSRSSKATGSLINNCRAPLVQLFGVHAGVQLYLLMSVGISSVFLLGWVGIAFYLGNSYVRAVKKNKVIC